MPMLDYHAAFSMRESVETDMGGTVDDWVPQFSEWAGVKHLRGLADAHPREAEVGRLGGEFDVAALDDAEQAGVGAIRFFDDGASTGGRIDLSLREAAWRIEVSWITGEVRVGPRPEPAR